MNPPIESISNGPSILDNVFKKTKFEGGFSTFTSATKVRKDLIKVGFEVFKKKGFSQKREMLVGIKRKKIIAKYVSVIHQIGGNDTLNLNPLIDYKFEIAERNKQLKLLDEIQDKSILRNIN